MDDKLLYFFNRQWTHPVADWVMAAASSFAAWTPLLIVGLALWLWRGGWKVRRFALVAALAVGVCDGVVSGPLKKIVDRARPLDAFSGVRVVTLKKSKPATLGLLKSAQVKLSRPKWETAGGRSFPSSHTMNTLAVAITALAFFGRRAWWTVPLALLVGYSRIYCGSHWPSDVLVSLFLGTGVTCVVLAFCTWAWRKWRPARWAHVELFDSPASQTPPST